MKLSKQVLDFFHKQRVVIISTLDDNGKIHCAAKGMVGIVEDGRVFVIDLYHRHTYENLVKNPTTSITAVDERKFRGYTLQGTAKIVPREEIEKHIIAEWEKRVIERISSRVVAGVKSGESSYRHHEAHLPVHPKYLIEIDVMNVIDLTPPH